MTAVRTGRTRVLVVEDEQDIAGLIKHALERASAIDVEIAASGDAALKSVAEAAPVYRGKHTVADFEAVSVAVDGAPVRLTRREFELLRYLVANRNRVLSRDRLLERVWGYDLHRNPIGGRARRAAARTTGPRRPADRNRVGLRYRFVE